jgi:hypothetical protein
MGGKLALVLPDKLQSARVLMTAFSVVSRITASVLGAVTLVAQDSTPASIQKLLPPDAKIIETAALRGNAGKSRSLVLWMRHPERAMRQGMLGCDDFVYGDRWYGPTRLSLVDPAKLKLVNTVEIRGLNEGADDKEHGFPLPFFVSNYFYYVHLANANNEGTPKILYLHDLTGEGAQGQFVLFEYYVCGTSLTTVLGYSPKSDRAVQYRLEISEQHKNRQVVSWVPHIFSEKPSHPGYWDFTWEPGHGADCTIREQVSFDRVRQIFVDDREIKSQR